jgi:hypothetical protein
MTRQVSSVLVLYQLPVTLIEAAVVIPSSPNTVMRASSSSRELHLNEDQIGLQRDRGGGRMIQDTIIMELRRGPQPMA